MPQVFSTLFAIGLISLSGSWLLLGAGRSPPPCNTVQKLPDSRVGAAGCLIVDGQHALLIRDRLSGQLGLPGGSANRGERAQCTAHRETWEETGLDVVVGDYLTWLDTDFYVYRCHARDVEPVAPLSVPDGSWAEVMEILWVRPEDFTVEDWRFPSQLQELQQIAGELAAEASAEGAADGPAQ